MPEPPGGLHHAIDMEPGSVFHVCHHSNGEQRLEDVAQPIVNFVENGKLLCAIVQSRNVPGVFEGDQMEFVPQPGQDPGLYPGAELLEPLAASLLDEVRS
jgi:hypothetical protein